ncbi:MAG: D-alanyl-D-alanine carboxypeptidase family protein [Desulfovibrionaceae bacterium]|nr:D-alanyl-D-alanine carboxypeptidase family protein [Desulfovibrionaceae bacterium]
MSQTILDPIFEPSLTLDNRQSQPENEAMDLWRSMAANLDKISANTAKTDKTAVANAHVAPRVRASSESRQSKQQGGLVGDFSDAVSRFERAVDSAHLAFQGDQQEESLLDALESRFDALKMGAQASAQAPVAAIATAIEDDAKKRRIEQKREHSEHVKERARDEKGRFIKSDAAVARVEKEQLELAEDSYDFALSEARKEEKRHKELVRAINKKSGGGLLGTLAKGMLVRRLLSRLPGIPTTGGRGARAPRGGVDVARRSGAFGRAAAGLGGAAAAAGRGAGSAVATASRGVGAVGRGVGSAVATVGRGIGAVGRGVATVGKAGLRAIPVIGQVAALGLAGFDAFNGWNDKAAQNRVFGLKEGQEATTGQKASTAIANVLDMGGLTTDLLGLLGIKFNKDALTRNLYDFGTQLGAVGGQLKDFAVAAWPSIKDKASKFGTFLWDSGKQIAASVGDWVADKWNVAVEGAKNFGNTLLTKGSELASAVGAWVSEQWEGVKTKASDFADKIGQGAVDIANNVASFASEKWNSILSYAGQLGDALWSGVGTIGTSIKNFADSAWNTVTTSASDMGAKLFKYAEQIGASFENFFSDSWDKVTKGAVDFGNALAKGAKDLWNDVVGFFTGEDHKESEKGEKQAADVATVEKPQGETAASKATPVIQKEAKKNMQAVFRGEMTDIVNDAEDGEIDTVNLSESAQPAEMAQSPDVASKATKGTETKKNESVDIAKTVSPDAAGGLQIVEGGTTNASEAIPGSVQPAITAQVSEGGTTNTSGALPSSPQPAPTAENAQAKEKHSSQENVASSAARVSEGGAINTSKASSEPSQPAISQPIIAATASGGETTNTSESSSEASQPAVVTEVSESSTTNTSKSIFGSSQPEAPQPAIIAEVSGDSAINANKPIPEISQPAPIVSAAAAESARAQKGYSVQEDIANNTKQLIEETKTQTKAVQDLFNALFGELATGVADGVASAAASSSGGGSSSGWGGAALYGTQQAYADLSKFTDRGSRNINPGNVKGRGYLGQVGVDDKNHAIFATKEAGVAGIVDRLYRYNQDAKKGDGLSGKKTIRQIMNTYAPASDNNDTNKYIANISRDLGISADAIIDFEKNPELMKPFIKSIMKNESRGWKAYSEAEIDKGIEIGVDKKRLGKEAAAQKHAEFLQAKEGAGRGVSVGGATASATAMQNLVQNMSSGTNQELASGVSTMIAGITQDAVNRGVRYKLGAKGLNGREIDCSGFVQAMGNATMNSINKAMGGEVFSRQVRAEFNHGASNEGAAGILRATSNMTGKLYQGAELAPENIREGMIIGSAKKGDARVSDRFKGIGHVVQTFRDPKTGEMMVSESTSWDTSRRRRNGVMATPYRQWYADNMRRRTHLYGADMLALADMSKAKIPQQQKANAEKQEPAKQTQAATVAVGQNKVNGAIDATPVHATPGKPLNIAEQTGLKLKADGSIDMSTLKGRNSLAYEGKVNVADMDPETAARMAAFAARHQQITGEKLLITEGYRSYAEQEAVRKKVGVAKSATPGKSNHGTGIAFDIKPGGIKNGAPNIKRLENIYRQQGLDFDQVLGEYGLSRPLLKAKNAASRESWHIEALDRKTHGMQQDKANLNSGKRKGSAYLSAEERAKYMQGSPTPAQQTPLVPVKATEESPADQTKNASTWQAQPAAKKEEPVKQTQAAALAESQAAKVQNFEQARAQMGMPPTPKQQAATAKKDVASTGIGSDIRAVAEHSIAKAKNLVLGGINVSEVAKSVANFDAWKTVQEFLPQTASSDKTNGLSGQPQPAVAAEEAAVRTRNRGAEQTNLQASVQATQIKRPQQAEVVKHDRTLSSPELVSMEKSLKELVTGQKEGLKKQDEANRKQDKGNDGVPEIPTEFSDPNANQMAAM